MTASLMTSPLLDSETTVYGRQEPLARVETLGNTAKAEVGIRFAAKYGLKLDPWQEIVLRSWLSYGPNGKFSHSRCGLSVPRQNGKSALLEARALIGMVLMGERILFTAHNTATARTFFRRLKGFFEDYDNYPELAEMAKSIKEAPGHEAIWLRKKVDGKWQNWGSLQVLARSKSTGRGFTVDVILFDEAQELADVALEAMAPATSAAPLKNRQLIFCGTPPSEVMNSEVFTGLRAACLEGSAVRVSWLEWAIPEGSSLDDPEMWAYANPALGYRLNISELAEDRAQYSDEGFARERGGMWSAAVSAAVIDARSWDDIKDSTSRVTDPVAIAVDISPDRSTASIAIAGERSDGLYHVEVIENRRGTDWVITALAYLVAQFGPVAVVVDGPASSLIPELGNLEVPVLKLGPSEFGAACGLFYDSVMNRRMRHLDQPLFTAAIDGARKRALGDMWAWGRSTSTTDITPVVAGTLALYGFASGRPVSRPKRVRRAITL
ncbi:terminase TerL endonuclease subunit [Nocardia grenadensis]|uniref:terminase TerL endonuclease subunit n=1 Tax=Nocardia grenadensis TaxID=931537 RepID=UPI003D72ACF3